MLALNSSGMITECRAKILGQGRCNHLLHQDEKESIQDFVTRVNKTNKLPFITPYRKPLTYQFTKEEKMEFSGYFRSCRFLRLDVIEKFSFIVANQSKTFHYEHERLLRDKVIKKYEKKFPGKVQDIFVVDRDHKNGPELHVLKNNGVLEVHNIHKLRHEKPSLITKMICRPGQVRRYYKWCNCSAPQYLIKIAIENEQKGLNTY